MVGLNDDDDPTRGGEEEAEENTDARTPAHRHTHTRVFGIGSAKKKTTGSNVRHHYSCPSRTLPEGWRVECLMLSTDAMLDRVVLWLILKQAHNKGVTYTLAGSDRLGGDGGGGILAFK